ncbi:MAG: type I glyceraldehyde-3-phosphate dehydrogenase, partial [Calditrichia bacterium]
IAVRVPVIVGSLIDFTFLSEKTTSAEEINNIFREAANKPEWQSIMKVADGPLVSTDILGESYGSIIDSDLTRVVGGDLVKVFSWYDNEWGYCAMLIKHIESLKDYL